MAIHVTSEVVFIYNRDSFRRQLFDAWEESIIDNLRRLANEEETVMKKPTRRDDDECDNREPLKRRRTDEGVAQGRQRAGQYYEMRSGGSCAARGALGRYESTNTGGEAMRARSCRVRSAEDGRADNPSSAGTART